MVGAIIGAALSAGSALANWLTSKSNNKKMNDAIDQNLREAKSDLVTDKYGNWRLAGADNYFNRTNEEVQKAMQQARAARYTTGKQSPDMAEAAGKTLAQAAGYANAQHETAHHQQAVADKQNIQNLNAQKLGVQLQHNKDVTAAWSQAAKAGGQLATALDGLTDNNGTSKAPKYAPGVNEHSSDAIKMGEAINNYKAEITPADQAGFKSNTGFDFSQMSAADAQKLLNQIGGL